MHVHKLMRGVHTPTHRQLCAASHMQQASHAVDVLLAQSGTLIVASYFFYNAAQRNVQVEVAPPFLLEHLCSIDELELGILFTQNSDLL